VKQANIAFWVMFIGFNVLYFPMLVVGIMGMPRRYYDYLPRFEVPNVISTIGSWILVTGIIMVIINFVKAKKISGEAAKNPWNGLTLEWTVSSPPTLENFDEVPTVTGGPYDYHKKEDM
jgi:cytochrome c oxidase subunit 1